MKKHREAGLLFLIFCFFALSLSAQDLDPRAYIRIPIKTTTLITGFGYSYGGVVTDPTLPVKNIDADVESPSLGVARSFRLGGMTAQGLMVLPYSFAQVSGDINEQSRSITREGLGDMRMRLSVLFHGAPALNVEDFKKSPFGKTLLGASINIVAPTGEFYSNKLINLGTNRWAFRPELALSQPAGKKWLFDIYAGIWFFTANNSYYPGTSVRKQDPMGSFQSHISYSFKPNLWLAFDATYYTGGTSTVDGNVNDDRQSNVRAGFTAVLPTGKFSSLKIAASRGAIVRIGQNFTTVSIGWQRSWFSFKKPPGK